MNLTGKKLLILGGIRLSSEIIEQAKKQGVVVYVTDYLEDSPGKRIADKSFVESATDVEAVTKLIKEEKIDGLLTGFIEFILPYYVEMCNETEIPCYATKEQINIATDKKRFKNLCRTYDVPVVEEYDINYPFTEEDIKHIEYPVLIKPVDNSGARGIFVCKNAIELIENYNKSLNYSNSKNIIIERYVQAREETIFYIIQDGEIYLSSMADRHLKKNENGIIPLPVAYIFPSKHLKEYQEELNNKVIKMFKSIGIKNGMIFIQTFVKNGEYMFYEMGYRLTPTLEYKIINEFNGINPMEMMINYSLTGSMYEKPIEDIINPNYDQYGFNITFLARPGKIGKVIGINKVRLFDGVIDVVSSYVEGDTIPETAIGTLKQVIIRVLGVVKTKRQMANLMDKIHRTIEVYSEEGEYMLLDVFDTKELFI